VIARRVRQKFDLIAEEQSAGGVHSDAHLTAWLAQNPSRFLQAAEGTDSGSRAHSQKSGCRSLQFLSRCYASTSASRSASCSSSPRCSR
jgi:hypothetical protein